MLALPLVLSVLLGAAKWKQMHPTATMIDLQERALLRERGLTIIVFDRDYNGYRGEIPLDEFRKVLDDFYLLDDEISDEKINNPMLPGQIGLEVRLKPDGDAGASRVRIGVSPSGYYLQNFNSQRPQFSHSLHPTTQHRLKELMDQKMIPYKSTLKGTPRGFVRR